jgi:hypothetical protein
MVNLPAFDIAQAVGFLCFFLGILCFYQKDDRKLKLTIHWTYLRLGHLFS